MIAPNVAHIPNFLAARSPQGLRRLMLLNNTKKGHVFVYQILYVADQKKWVAWYNDTNQGLLDELKEASDGSAE
jgi:hypothetical protein